MPRVETRVPRGRSRAGIRLINITDFTGGLNLTREQFRIAENESPSLLNVDLGQRGGFKLRRPVAPLNGTGLASDPRSVWIYRTPAGTNQLLVNVGDTVHYSTGGNFTDCTIGAGATTLPFRAVTFNNLNYIQRGAEQVAVKWDGAADTSLTANAPTWQNDLAAPTGGYMPKAKCIASHGGYVWVANTVENGVAFPNRVRWSHAGRPEDWREADYIDVEVGADGDQIVALVPYSDHLLVFKQRSMHAIFGYDYTTFQVATIDRARGTISQDTVAATPGGVYFFHWPEGVFIYEGKRGGTWIFEKIYPAIRDGEIPSTYRDKIMLGYGMGRLWVTVPFDAATTRSHTFVYDPTLGKGGAWTFYDLKTGPYAEWVTGTTTIFVGGYVGSNRILKLEQPGDQDDYGSGATNYSSYFTTAWFDDDQPAVRKRWKRAEAVLHHEGAAMDLTARVFRDWDGSNWYKEFIFHLDAINSMLWVGGGAGDNWDENDWATEGDTNVIEKGANLGTARAVSLKFTPPANITWGVEALVLKYIPRTVRS